MPLHVLVFDSDPSIRNLLKTYLEEKGHIVTTYADPSRCPVFGSDAACACQRDGPCADVLITDIRLPETNAIDFVRRQIKKGCKAPPANKAIMSASLTKAQQEAILALGCRPLKKPFRLSELRDWIEQCANRLEAR